MLNLTHFQTKEENVQVADDSLSETDPLSCLARHLLSGLKNPRRG